MSKKALITGITGQDGSYLAEFLLEKGYEVHGIVRRSSSFNTFRIDHIYDRVHLHYGDIIDIHSVYSVINKVKPDELYNLAAQSHVKVSFEIPDYTCMTDALGVLRVLEAVRECGLEKTCRVYQASTSEMFGNAEMCPQNELTPLMPQSPYGCAKVYAHHLVRNYREAYGMFICSGILFNHESPRRDPRFVTRKVTRGVANYVSHRDTFEPIVLGNLSAKRDWGFAGDYVRGMWSMLQQDTPQDFVLATGVTRSIRELVETAFLLRGIEVTWTFDKLSEKAIDKNNGCVLVEVDARYFRPAEVFVLKGDASKAHKVLDWKPECTFKKMLDDMITIDES